MAQVTNKQNMTIAIREYQDNQGQTKKVWKTIGEITTWDDGSQSFEVWGPTGSTQGQVFDKQDNNQQQGGYQNNAPQHQYNNATQQHAPQQGYNNAPPQQGYNNGYGNQ